MPDERAGDPGNRANTIADLAEAAGPGSVDGRHLLLVGVGHLIIAQQTTKTHVGRIAAKLNVPSRWALTRS